MVAGPINRVRPIKEVAAQMGSRTKREIPKGVKKKITIKKLKYLDPNLK